MTKTLCPVCGKGILDTRRETRRYGRGVDVTLVNVPVRHCPACGEEFVMVPAIEELHRLIAHDLARSRSRLRPGGIRFLRTYLGYSSTDFAAVMGVTPETVSRWESKRSPQPMSATAERLLRLMALQDKPVESYGLEETGADGTTEPVTLRLTATPEGWAAA
jgi:putative zinc finger/helix-turn-helix YgiT family protein